MYSTLQFLSLGLEAQLQNSQFQLCESVFCIIVRHELEIN